MFHRSVMTTSMRWWHREEAKVSLLAKEKGAGNSTRRSWGKYLARFFAICMHTEREKMCLTCCSSRNEAQVEQRKTKKISPFFIFFSLLSLSLSLQYSSCHEQHFLSFFFFLLVALNVMAPLLLLCVLAAARQRLLLLPPLLIFLPGVSFFFFFFFLVKKASEEPTESEFASSLPPLRVFFLFDPSSLKTAKKRSR